MITVRRRRRKMSLSHYYTISLRCAVLYCDLVYSALFCSALLRYSTLFGSTCNRFGFDLLWFSYNVLCLTVSSGFLYACSFVVVVFFVVLCVVFFTFDLFVYSVSFLGC